MEETLMLALKVYAQYSAWLREAPRGLSGSMVLLAAQPSATGPSGSTLEALARAANIAGAATLVVGHEPASGRDAVRSGMCDVLVTNLDEALRILKNALRQRRQVAVSLAMKASQVLAACVARGVQPHWLGEEEPSLLARGARVAPQAKAGGEEQMTAWRIPSAAAAGVTTQWYEAALSARSREPATAAQWLASSPEFLSRDLARWHTLPMTEPEARRFVGLLQQARELRHGALDVEVRWGGESLSLE